MTKAVIFDNENGEWFISWADPNEPIWGYYASEEEAIEVYRKHCPDLPDAYRVDRYSQMMEWAG